LGIPAFMLVKIFAAVFYSRQNIATPVRIAVIATVSNAVLDVILIFPLAHAGLALATSLASFLNAGFLFYLLRRRNFYQPGSGWWVFWLRLLIANALMAVFLIIFAYNFTTWLHWSSLNRVIHLGLLCTGAFLIYCGTLWCSGMRFKDFILEK
jgi:putative peptidoglycan lipid II flippase